MVDALSTIFLGLILVVIFGGYFYIWWKYGRAK